MKPLGSPASGLKGLTLAVLLLPVVATRIVAQTGIGQVVAQQKISDTQGGLVASLDDGAQFGHTVSNLGDIDGDGIDDIAVGASESDLGPVDEGAVLLLRLNVDGTVKSETIIAQGLSGFALETFPVDNFGSTVEGIGDLDGDGDEDIVIGANGDSTAGVGKGAIYIVRLKRDGTVQAVVKHAAGASGTPLEFAAGAFGQSIACLGDIDNDGVTDIAVGAFLADELVGGETATGVIWILRLNANGTIKAATRIGNGEGGLADVLDTDDFLGTCCEGLGDFDGDGIEDVAAGAQGDDDGATDAGAVWLFMLNSNGTVKASQKISATSFGLVGPLDASDDFGRSIALLEGLGDPDLIVLAVGASGDSDQGVNRGAVWELFIDPLVGVMSEVKINGASGGFAGALDNSDAFGSAVTPILSPAGPAGQTDLVVGAVGDDDGGAGTGAVWVLRLQTAPGAPPFSPFQNSLNGRAGRTALIVPLSGLAGFDGAAPRDEFDESVVVVPRIDDDLVVSELLAAQADGSLAVGEGGQFSTGPGPSQAATADFNDDLDTDVITANKGGGSFSYLQGLGDGTFAVNVDFDLPFDDAPIALAVADMNGDTEDDVVVAGDGGVTVFLGNGTGGFVSQSYVPVALLTDLALAKVDGDADVDVVATSGAVALGPGMEQGFATVLLNNGAGTLAAGSTFASGKALASVLLGDIDNDNDVDALLAVHEFDAGPGGVPQGRIQLHLNNGAGVFGPSGAFAGYATPDAAGIHPTYGALADIDNDTWLDAVYTSSDNLAFAPETFTDEQPPLTVTVLLNDQAGGFAVTEIPTVYAGRGVAPMLQQFVPIIPDGNVDAMLVFYVDIAAGQGGTPDYDTFLALLSGDGTGGFFDPAPNQFVAGNEPGSPETGDMNGDDPADGGSGGPDIVVPNLADNSLSVLLGDGAGGITTTLSVPDVDDLDGGSLPPGLWVGGPRDVVLATMNAGATLDAVVYNAWQDNSPVAPNPAVFASLSLFTGDGTGDLDKVQYLSLARGGDVAVGDITLDGNPDVVVTQRLGSGPSDSLKVYPGLGTGAVNPVPQSYGPPGTYVLSGGLAVVDVSGDGKRDVITTGCQDGRKCALVVYLNINGTLGLPVEFAMDGQWDSVRSLDVGDLTGDGLLDVAIGIDDGRLFLGENNGSGIFEEVSVSEKAADLAGGALRLGKLNGDGLLDIVSAAAPSKETPDQAFVRLFHGEGGGVFDVSTVSGVSSFGELGALRPALADMNNDAALDLILSHGNSDSVSVLLNALATWERYGPGKAGKGGLVPSFAGTGFTTPGEAVTLKAANAVGGAPAELWVGLGKLETGFLAVQLVLVKVPLVLGGTPGTAGAGGFTLPATLPNDSTLVGIEITMQVLLLDTAAGPPAPGKIAMTNGLAFTIVQ